MELESEMALPLFVPSREEAMTVKKAFELKSGINYCRFGEYAGNEEIGSRSIHFVDKNGVVKEHEHPFINVKTDIFECMYGKDRHAARKLKEQVKEEERMKEDHPLPLKRKYRKCQASKKKGCPASLILKEVILFTDYKINNISEWEKRQMSKDIRSALDNGEAELTQERRVYIKYPTDEAHQTVHELGPLTRMLRPLAPEIASKIEELVRMGVGKVNEMRRHLKHYIEKELFPDPCRRPATYDFGYYPDSHAVAQKICASKMQLRYSKVDQENLRLLVQEWKQQNPKDKFELHLPEKPPSVADLHYDVEDDEVVPSPSTPNKFFFCHQTEFQRHLLSRYGNDMCFLDATYKTSQFALPLFFLAVQTNVGYSVVGQFIVQSETAEAIQQGLQTLKGWMEDANSSWNPANFMTNFCEREITAIEELFPATQVFICDFHREQAWTRWMKKVENGVGEAREAVLALMRNCASSRTEEELEVAISKLKTCHEWETNHKLQRWMTRTWLPQVKRWSRAFRNNDGFKAHTNNGLERQNRVFKQNFLSESPGTLLSDLASTLINDYLPNRMRQYVIANVRADAGYGRAYDPRIPPFLWDRPPAFVRHCMDRLSSSHLIGEGQIRELGDNCFDVKSETFRGEMSYKVSLGDETRSLFCECADFQSLRLPCKHIFAVIGINNENLSWDSLPVRYRESPFISLDRAVGKFATKLPDEDTPDDMTEDAFSHTGVDEDPLGNWAPLPSRKSRNKQLATACREKLSLLKDGTYLCEEEGLLTDLLQQLEGSLAFLRSKLHVQNGMPVHPDPPRHRKRKHAKASTTPSTFSDLPRHKKRKRNAQECSCYSEGR